MSKTFELSDRGKHLMTLRQKARAAVEANEREGDHSETIASSLERLHSEADEIASYVGAMAAKIHEHKASKDQAYLERNTLVALLARLYPSGLRPTAIEGWNPAWHNCVYIDLPSGQISFHYHDDLAHLFQGLPAYTKPYDGHDKATVMKRIRDAFGYDFLSTANLIRN